MPKKYRPPSPTRRRKDRKTNIPYDFERPEEQPSVADTNDGPLDEDAPLVAVDVAEPPPEPEDLPFRRVSRTPDEKGERHVARDYSYVRGEILRIAAIGAFLLIALAITAVFR